MSQLKTTRIKHKHDIEANWLISKLMPLDGEIIIYDPDEDHDIPRFKVGDGETALNDLPFVITSEGGGGEFQGQIYTLTEKNKLKALPTNEELSETLEGLEEQIDNKSNAPLIKGEGEGSVIMNNEISPNVASGNYAFAEGSGTIASGEAQHVQGKYNIEDTENKYAHIVGNGTNNSARSNAHTIDWEGNAWFAGNIMANGILLTDQVTKDIYELVISNGEIKIRNINKLTLELNENEAQVNIDTETLVLSNDIATVSNETLSLNNGEIK